MDRGVLWLVLTRQGVPPKLLKALQNLHEDMEGCVQYSNELSGKFRINTGVRQGSVEGPVLLHIAHGHTDRDFPRDSLCWRELGIEMLAEYGDILNTKHAV